MPLIEILKQTLDALWANKLRSFLTMFGIVWGIMSVILLVGLGIGFTRDQKEQMRGLGTDIAILWGGKTGAQAGGYSAGREIRLNKDDAVALQRLPLLKAVSPELSHNVNEVSRLNAASQSVHGIWPEYQDFRNLNIESGRRITQADEDSQARVVVMGNKIRQQLFPGVNPLGETVALNGLPYTVIGVLSDKKQNSSYGDRDVNLLFIPFSSMERDLPTVRQGANAAGTAQGVERGYVNNIVVQPIDTAHHRAAVREVYALLGARHHFDPTDKEALFVWDTLQGSEQMETIFNTMTLFFGVVAVLTLTLGGIGVMNIMLVAVTERTREIGVRKALGARARDIQLQFLAESAIITLLSGAVGISLGIGACLLAKLVPQPDFVPHPAISAVAIIASLVTLALITVTAGTYPALRARALSPMECLRSE